ANVVAAPDCNGGGTVLAGPFTGPSQRAPHQPGAWQPVAIPGGNAVARRQDARFAAKRHAAVLQLRQVTSEQRQAMGVMPQQVSLDQDFSNIACPLMLQPDAGEKPQGEIDKRACLEPCLSHGTLFPLFDFRARS